MFDLSNKFSNVFDVLTYTIAAMRESGFEQSDIDDYLIDATSTHNSHLVDVSIDFISQCNNRIHAYDNDVEDIDDIEYTPCKYYWEDDEDEDEYEYEGFSDKTYYARMMDYDDDEDEYEGFSDGYRKYY